MKLQPTAGYRERDSGELRERGSLQRSASGTFRTSELVNHIDGVPSRYGDDLKSVIRRGLLAPKKNLPWYLHYDEAGSRLFDEVAKLREYYVLREERALLVEHSEAIAEVAFANASVPPCAIELSAGSGAESQVLLHALNERYGLSLYLPVDISVTALSKAESRLASEEPKSVVQPLVMTNEEALRRVSNLERNKMLMMLGGALGSYPRQEAQKLLTNMRCAITADDAIVLSTDMVRDDIDDMLAACDDPQGVCASFNKNVLTRLNRELGGTFDASLFEHVVRWNPVAQAVEMHLESTVAQTVTVGGVEVSFRQGESIQTQSHFKYDIAQFDAMLRKAGLRRQCTFLTADDGFALHVLRKTSGLH